MIFYYSLFKLYNYEKVFVFNRSGSLRLCLLQ